MSINMERQVLKGQLSDLKMKKMKLETSIAANLKAVKMILAGAAITPIAQIDIEGALVNLKEAAAQKRELTQVIKDIEIIEAELE